MKRYDVRVTIQAQEDVFSYAKYIRDELLNPQAAEKFVNDMRKAVNSLDSMPKRNPLVDEEPWHSMSVYKMVARGYLVYYWIEENTAQVHVTGVVYGRRSQIDQLADMDFEQ